MHVLVEDHAGRIQSLRPTGPADRAGSGAAWGVSLDRSVLEMEGALTEATPPRVVVRSGFIPDEDRPGEPDPRTWGPAGWSALDRGLRACLTSPGPRLLIRPAATDVVSDAPSCLRYLQRRGEWGGDGTGDAVARLGLLLDPVAMLAPSMHASAEDHVARIMQLVVPVAGVDAVALIETPLVPFAKLVAMFRALAPAEMPLVVSAGALRVHASLLGLGDAPRQ
jgi:hypothetical protein